MTTANTVVVMPGLLRQRAGANEAASGANDAAEARGAKGVTGHGEGTEQDLE
jgi:hypothetical protein